MSGPDDVRARALRTLGGDGTAEARSAVLVAGLGQDLGLSHCRLYVRDGEGEPLRLAHGWSGTSIGGDDPQLELHTVPVAPLGPVTTTSGAFQALSLPLGGARSAVLLLRDHAGGLSRGARRAVLQEAPTLAAVVGQLRREAALERDLAATTARSDSGRRLHGSAVELEQFLRLLLELAVSATTSEAGFVAVAGPTGELVVRARIGLAPELPLDLSPQNGLFDWELAEPDAPLLLRDPQQAAELGMRSVLALPLQRDGLPLGVIGLATLTRPAAFGSQSLQLLSSFLDQISLMLDNQRVFAEFTERYLGVLEGLAAAVDARRPGTVGYAPTVAAVAAATARQLGLSAAEQEALHRAGLLHDIGLAALPGARDRYAVDVEHPVVGAGLLETVPVSPVLVSAVQCHHEWFDGWGFPGGLRGEQIPLGGRVLAYAAFAADMRTGDPARPAWQVERIVAEVRSRSGSQFDPQVVEVGAPLLGDVLSELQGG